MLITAIHDTVSPIRSSIANAYIDFSQMTASVVAVRAAGGVAPDRCTPVFM